MKNDLSSRRLLLTRSCCSELRVQIRKRNTRNEGEGRKMFQHFLITLSNLGEDFSSFFCSIAWALAAARWFLMSNKSELKRLQNYINESRVAAYLAGVYLIKRNFLDKSLSLSSTKFPLAATHPSLYRTLQRVQTDVLISTSASGWFNVICFVDGD